MRKRALEQDKSVEVSGKLPYLYRALAPITYEHHSALNIKSDRNFGFAEAANAIPILADEFVQVARQYPIVIADVGNPVPVALVGLEKGKNDHINADGTWRADHYVPAYLRRYPFMLLKETATSERMILCADLTSTQFSNTPKAARPLFESKAGGEVISGMLDFCQRYEKGLARTRAMMLKLAKLDLIQGSTVGISRGGKTARVEGFATIAEDKLRALDDATLADLTRRGITALIAAHHHSMANFSDFGNL